MNYEAIAGAAATGAAATVAIHEALAQVSWYILACILDW
jgi:hypothetical protein